MQSTDRQHHWFVDDPTELLPVTAKPHDGPVRVLVETPQFLKSLIADIQQLLQLCIHLYDNKITTLQH